jgi:hypothetical protein
MRTMTQKSVAHVAMPLRRKSGAITAGRRSMKRIASERKKREALKAGGSITS